MIISKDAYYKSLQAREDRISNYERRLKLSQTIHQLKTISFYVKSKMSSKEILEILAYNIEQIKKDLKSLGG